jgi:AcrR family transcriptional regulator
VQPSVIRHYVGNRDDVIAAAVDRALANVQDAVNGPVEGLSPRERLEVQLGLLFGGPLDAPAINHLVDQLVAHSYLDPPTRTALRDLYRRFQQLLLDALDGVFPEAPAEARRQTATGLLALAHAGATFAWLDVDEHSAEDGRVAAWALIERLLGPDRGEVAQGRRGGRDRQQVAAQPAVAQQAE